MQTQEDSIENSNDTAVHDRILHSRKNRRIENLRRQSTNFIMSQWHKKNHRNNISLCLSVPAETHQLTASYGPSKRLQLLAQHTMCACITLVSSPSVSRAGQAGRRPTAPACRARGLHDAGTPSGTPPSGGRPTFAFHKIQIEHVDCAVIVDVAGLPKSRCRRCATSRMLMSAAFTTPSRLKSPGYVAITVTVCATGSSSQPSVNPLLPAVESLNWPTSHSPPS